MDRLLRSLFAGVLAMMALCTFLLVSARRADKAEILREGAAMEAQIGQG